MKEIQKEITEKMLAEILEETGPRARAERVKEYCRFLEAVTIDTRIKNPVFVGEHKE